MNEYELIGRLADLDSRLRKIEAIHDQPAPVKPQTLIEADKALFEVILSEVIEDYKCEREANYYHRCALAVLSDFLFGENCERFCDFKQNNRNDNALVWAAKSAMNNHAWVVCSPVDNGMRKLKNEIASGELFTKGAGDALYRNATQALAREKKRQELVHELFATFDECRHILPGMVLDVIDKIYAFEKEQG